jgi:hypothetical protein
MAQPGPTQLNQLRAFFFFFYILQTSGHTLVVDEGPLKIHDGFICESKGRSELHFIEFIVMTIDEQ